MTGVPTVVIREFGLTIFLYLTVILRLDFLPKHGLFINTFFVSNCCFIMLGSDSGYGLP